MSLSAIWRRGVYCSDIFTSKLKLSPAKTLGMFMIQIRNTIPKT
jgi:hypothetical protein